jgi:hypothetical protein
MKGSLHTDELMAAWSSASGLRTKRRVSHCFVLQTPPIRDRFIVTDAAINIAPDLEQKADIVRNAIDLAHAIGVAEPKVAILAAVETVNPNMPATLDAAALCKMADRGQITGGLLDGPLAFDNAVSPGRAHQGHRLRGGRPGRHPGRARPGERQHAGQAARIPGRRASAGIVLGARVPVDPDQPRRFARVAHRLVRHRAAAGAPLSADATMTAKDLILVLNCGSSSIKFALFDAAACPLPRQPLWNGKVQGIGGPGPDFGETGVCPVCD